MCDMVCGGQLDIATAQEAFAKDWIAAYHKYTKLIDAKLGEASVRHNSSRATSITLARRVQSVPSSPLLISAC